MALIWLMVRTVFLSVCVVQAYEYCPGKYNSFSCPQYTGGPDDCCDKYTGYNRCCWGSTPDPYPDSSWDNGYDTYYLSVGAIVGIAVGSLVLIGIVIAIIVAACCCCCCAANSGAKRPNTVTHIHGGPGIPMTTTNVQSYPQGQPAYPGGQQVPTGPGQPPFPGQQAYVGQPQGYPGQPQAYQATGYGQPPTGQYSGAPAAGQYHQPSAPAGQYQQPDVPGAMAGPSPSDLPPQYEPAKEN